MKELAKILKDFYKSLGPSASNGMSDVLAAVNWVPFVLSGRTALSRAKGAANTGIEGAISDLSDAGRALAPFLSSGSEVVNGLLEDIADGTEGVGDVTSALAGSNWRRDNARSAFESAQNATTPKVDPIVIDFNRDGVTDTASAKFFDADANGLVEATAWASSGDAMLVLDSNDNGRIDDGSELFGDRTPLANGQIAASGFQALAELDDNGDGVVDASDEKFEQLRAWADLNGDGNFGDDELVSMKEAGIASFDLNGEESESLDAAGNAITRTGSLTWDDGKAGVFNEYLLRSDTTLVMERELLAVPEDVLAMPNLHGRGGLYSLRQAMVRDETGKLQELVDAFAAEEDPAVRQGILDELLFAWSGTGDATASDRGGAFDAQKLAFLEGYLGTTYTPQSGLAPDEAAAELLEEAYDQAKTEIYSELLAQTHCADLIASSLALDSEDPYELVDMGAALSQIYDTWTENAQAGTSRLREYLLALEGSALRQFVTTEELQQTISELAAHSGQGEEFAAIFKGEFTVNLSVAEQNHAAVMRGYAGGDSLTGGNGDDTLHAGDGADTLRGGGGNDVIFGEGGDDSLYGEDGDDTLVGGAGNDTLEGGNGNDTYIWNLGDGDDTILDRREAAGTTFLQIGEGVAPADVRLTRNKDDLVFLMGDDEKVIVKDWYANTFNKLTEIQFADGTVWSTADIDAMSLEYAGTDGDDALAGHDTNDIINGGAGNDNLKGGKGDDTLIGGAGDDMLEGGRGNDTYVWNPGDGNDTIRDLRETDGTTSILKIGEGIVPTDIQLTRKGDDLLFLMGDGETITVKEWYNGNTPLFQLTEVQFADGTAWSAADIGAMPLIFTGTDGNDTLKGYDTNDTMIGGAGDDTLEGGRGNDTYIWNPGDGSDTIRDFRNTEDTTSVLEIGEGVTPADVQLTRNGNDLILLMNEGERVTVKDWYTHSLYRLTEVKFADGTAWKTADIDAMPLVFVGTDGDDTISGYSTNDTLNGGAGQDILRGGDGDDTLTGGAGDDTLEGGYGNDTYIWNPGDGSDTISDTRRNGSETSILKIGEGVDPANIQLARSGSDLALLMGNGEKITVKDWFSHTLYQLSNIQFADGTAWTNQDINEIASGMKQPFRTQSASSLFGMAVDPTVGVQTSYRYDSEIDALSSLAATPTDWGSDPTLASIMNGPEIATVNDFAASQLNMDIAIASLLFGRGALEQVFDFAGNAASTGNPYAVSSSVASNIKRYFTEDRGRN